MVASAFGIRNWIENRAERRRERDAEDVRRRAKEEYDADVCLSDELFQELEEKDLSTPEIRRMIVAAYPSQEARYSRMTINEEEKRIADKQLLKSATARSVKKAAKGWP